MIRRFLSVRWLYAFAILLGMIAVIYISVSQRLLPIPHGTNRWYYGNINQGRKFGFEVGALLKKTSPQPNYGLVYYGSGRCEGVYRTIAGCLNQSDHASYEIRRPFYYGQVFVEYDERGIITSIIWNADAFPLEWVA